MHAPRLRARSAFTLIELLLVVAIIALLISILLPSLAGARKAARTGLCMSNMRQYAVGIVAYGSDSKGFVPSFSWLPSKQYSAFNDLNNAPTYPDAGADQAVDIVRRVRGVTAAEVPQARGRMYNRNFTHLVLIDGGYYSDRALEPGVVCPEDRGPLLWQREPHNMAAFRAQGLAPADPNGPLLNMLPYWSSYQIVPCTWTWDKGTGTKRTIDQYSDNHHLYTVPPTNQIAPFTARRMDEISLPSLKVAAFDLFDRHRFKRTLYYAYPQAAQPLVFFDGSVSVRTTRDAEKGFQPNAPTSTAATTHYYDASYWAGYEPPCLTPGITRETVTAHYRWTRNGLKGFDFRSGGSNRP